MAGYTALGAAVAVADFDGDGFDDLFVTDSASDGRNHLYRNNGDFTFTEVAAKAGVADGQRRRSNASADALWFDYNNDGRPDLFVVRFGQQPAVSRTSAAGRFNDVTGRPGSTATSTASPRSPSTTTTTATSTCSSAATSSRSNLFNPETPRFFPESFETAQQRRRRHRCSATTATARSPTSTETCRRRGLSGWTLDLGHADADNDGDDDLYVAATSAPTASSCNNGDGTFTDITEKAIGIDTKKGMNVDWGDFDNDGLLDIYVTNITDDYMREGNFLWKNNGRPDLHRRARARPAPTTRAGAGPAKFFDYDNDGWLDLYVVNGWVSAGDRSNYVLDIFEMIIKPEIDLADARNWPPMGNKSLSGYQKKRLFHNERRAGCSATRRARHGVDSIADGRGIAVADFDNDGRARHVRDQRQRRAVPLPQHDAGDRAHWVEFVLTGTRSNRRRRRRPGCGVTAGGRTQLRFVDGGNGFAGQRLERVHFGLGHGDRRSTSLEIAWPSGRAEHGSLTDIASPVGSARRSSTASRKGLDDSGPGGRRSRQRSALVAVRPGRRRWRHGAAALPRTRTAAAGRRRLTARRLEAGAAARSPTT